MLWRLIDPDYQGEIGLPLHNGGKKDYVGVQEIVTASLDVTMSCECD